MKKFRFIALTLSIAMVFTLFSNFAFATNHTADDIVPDKISASLEESIYIDGTQYIYDYSYEGSNRRVTKIYNTDAQTEDVIIFDLTTGSYSLNGEVIGSVSTKEGTKSVPAVTRAGWESFGSYDDDITGFLGVSITTAAGAICSILMHVPVGALIATVGNQLLSVITSTSDWVRVTGTAWLMRSGIYVTYKDVFRLTFFGHVTDEYTILTGL